MRTDIDMMAHERLDDLHCKGYHIIQDPQRFCFGIDAVILSGFTRVKKGEQVLDLGTGTGIIPILLAAKTQGEKFTGLEIQQESAEMATRSVKLNELEERVSIVHGDLKEAKTFFGAGTFDVVVSDPPYMNEGGGLVNPGDAKAIARHEICCSLEDVVQTAGQMLKVNGRFYMIHRPHRLVDILTTLRQFHLEPKKVRFIHSYVDKEPSMVLIEAIKGAKAMVKIGAPLVIYESDGTYTKEIFELYYKEGNA